jgi:hypothetical protein
MNRLTKWLGIGAGIGVAGYATYVATTWLRYGRPRRKPDEDPLLDELIGTYDVCERHEIAVDAPPEVTLATATEMRLDGSPISRAIFRTRDVIMRSERTTDRPKGLLELTKSIGWGVLAEVPGREIVMGAVTKPWTANPVFRPLPREAFAAFAEPDHVKIVWTLRTIPTADGGSIFRTETRAVATDAGAREKFRLYWSLLSPGILLIRAAMLPGLKAAAERARPVEGDDILSDARAKLTHSITIDVAPKDVWPWLVQMGCQRAGWYSWDILDNAGKRSADQIVPELQHLEIGDVLPARPTGDEGFEVIRVVPERALVLSSRAKQFVGTWAFSLEPLGPTKTRLVTRYRATYEPSTRMSFFVPIMAAVHSMMERRQLRTIKHHAELRCQARTASSPG